MSNEEHLIENALCMLEKGKELKDFMLAPVNVMMLSQSGLTSDQVWRMAVHIYYTFRPDWIEEGRQEMVQRYGYMPPEE